jgi:hypothetical protein
MSMKRRAFLKSSVAAAATLSLGASRVLGANDDIRLGTIGVGSFVKIGGKGRGDVRDFRKIPGVRVTALCDCDSDNLGHEVERFKKRNEPVKAFRDFRDLLDDPEIDAISITTPNHWHSLMAIMACQAGKDVFVQSSKCEGCPRMRRFARPRGPTRPTKRWTSTVACAPERSFDARTGMCETGRPTTTRDS